MLDTKSKRSDRRTAVGRAFIALPTALTVLLTLAVAGGAVDTRSEHPLATVLGIAVMVACVVGMIWMALDSERHPRRWPAASVIAALVALFVAASLAGVCVAVLGSD